MTLQIPQSFRKLICELFQACLYTLNYDASICANLTAEENVDYEVEVQRVANRFNFVATLLQVG